LTTSPASQHFAENPYFTNPSLTKSYVPTSGPTRGLTASELIGRARPSDLSTIPEDIGEKTQEEEKEKHAVVKAPEGEEWDVKKVQEETGEEVKLANTFFDEMDDLFGLVSLRRFSSFVAEQQEKNAAVCLTHRWCSCLSFAHWLIILILIAHVIVDRDQVEVGGDEPLQVVPQGRTW
jgi:hypothetical protein